MKRENIEDVYRLSPVQQGMLFHAIYNPETGMYFEQFQQALQSASWQPELGIAAWQSVVDNHPILRTSFLWEGLEEPVQLVHRKAVLPVSREDWRGVPPEEQEARLGRLMRDERGRGFDLTQAPLLRLAIVRLADDVHVVVVNFHHLLLDGWSVGLVVREVVAAYDALETGRPLPPVSRRPFRDYIAWLLRQDLAQAESYWRRTLAGFIAPTPLGGNASSDASSHEQYRGLKTLLSKEDFEGLQALARRNRITLHTLVEGAWALTLSRYTGYSDLVFGSTVSGRPHALPGSDSMVGCFINTLPIRVRLAAEERVIDWLKRLQSEQIEMRKYEYSPLVQVRGWSEVPGDLSLFDSLLVFESFTLDAAVSTREVGRFQRTNYPLVAVAEPGELLELRLGFDANRFDPATMGRMLIQFQLALESFLGAEEAILADLPSLPGPERHALLVEWNDSPVAHPAAGLVQELVDAVAAEAPDGVLVVAGSLQLTLREAVRRGNQLGHHLQKLGIGPERVVGVCTERSAELVIGILGILRAGGAYLPLDPSLPADRLAYMLEDTGAPVLLTQERLVPRLPRFTGRVICLDTEPALAGEPESVPECRLVPDNAVYVIYTSGSTGQPKGVVVPHRGVANHLHFDRATILHEGAHFLQKASIGFDVSASEVFSALAVPGGQLVIADAEQAQDSTQLLELILDHGVTGTSFPPTLLSVLLEQGALAHCASLRSMVTGGETVPADLPPQLYAQLEGCDLFNRYGPTEASISVTAWLCRRGVTELTLPIGRPIADAEVYLLDAGLEPVPVGAVGQIFLGGVGLARGYWGKPALTAEKFVPSPSAALLGQPGARLYATGDLGRFRPDGALEFAGRIDHQVKIRGFRIELGEIESALDRHPAVREAVVVDRGEGSSKVLVAYLVPEAGQRVPPSAMLRTFLAGILPSYMIPTLFVSLETLPLTSTGKVDRRALPAPANLASESGEVWEAPRGPLEEILAAQWSEILDLDRARVRVGRFDGFFELGGHSLLATKVISRLRETFATELPLSGLFKASILADLGRLVEQTLAARDEIPAPAFHRLPAAEQRVLSWTQERLASRLRGGDRLGNLIGVTRWTGALDTERLEAALGSLVTRHDVLRLGFGSGLEPLAAAGGSRPELRREDWSHLAAGELRDALAALCRSEAETAFDLGRPPLLRAVLVRLAEAEHRLVFVLHPLVADAESVPLLVRDLALFYRMAGPEEEGGTASGPLGLPVPFADWASWQRTWPREAARDAQLAEWRQRLAGAPVLELPADRRRTGPATGELVRTARLLPPALAAELAKLSRRAGAGTLQGLLAASALHLGRLADAGDAVVGLTVSPRDRETLEGIVGPLANAVPVRAELAGAAGFLALLGQVQRSVVAAFVRRDWALEDLSRALGRPFPEALFAAERPAEDLALPGLALGLEAVHGASPGVDFSCRGLETTEGLHVVLELAADRFDAGSGERLLRQLQTLLEGALSEPDRAVASLPLIGAEERRQLLAGWNQPSALGAELAERLGRSVAGIAGGEEAGAGSWRLHVLDRHLQAMPAGAAGELCVGGEGLGWGYLGRPDLTAERFVPDPFVGLASDQPGGRLFRTGERVRFDAGGRFTAVSTPEPAADLPAPGLQLATEVLDGLFEPGEASPLDRQEEENLALLRADAELDPQIRPRSGRLQSDQLRRVFLTGSTGYLGAFLLAELLEQTAAEIHCLVRAADPAAGVEKLRRHLQSYGRWQDAWEGRLVAIPGDLARPRLGLTEPDFELLAQRADALVHNGALVHFLHDYRTLRAPNVLGTQEVLRLACRGTAKPFHYVSTLSVFHTDAFGEAGVAHESDPLSDPAGLAGGYAQSKWVAEKLVAAAGARGLPVTIHRPGRIGGDTVTGAWTPEDFLVKVVKGCIELGSAPDLDASISMAPVDFVARSIVWLSRQPRFHGRAFHPINPHLLPMRELFDHLRLRGYALEPLPFAEWRQRLIADVDRGADNALSSLLTLSRGEGRKSSGGEVRFDCAATQEALAGSGVECPPVDEELLQRSFDYLIGRGFLPQPSAARVAEVGAP